MKFQLCLWLFVFILGFTLFGNSFAQKATASSEEPSLPLVSLQLQLRNSEGQLITYIEPTTMYIVNLSMVHEFLDTIENKTIIEKDGQMFELIQYESLVIFSSTQQIATYAMVYKEKHSLVFRHDGFIALPGDTLDVSWKIIRTIQ